MAKKSRRKSSYASVVSLKRVVIIALPIFAAFFFFANSPSPDVLGESDKRKSLFNLDFTRKATDSAKHKKNRVATFSLSGLCSNGRNGFTSATYTCEDGTGGTLSSACFSPQSAFEKAAKACGRNSKVKPSQPPSPTPSL